MQGSATQKGFTSNPAKCARYEVCLSFRSEDMQNNFTDYLCTALVKVGFHTFKDDNANRRDENIPMKVQKAIQESGVSVVILSNGYASSRWCLDELVQIMECRRTGQHHVIPIFYYIDPSQIRKQSGDYATALTRHERGSQEDMDKVNMWRKALREAADLGGMVFQNRSQSTVIEDVVKEITKRLDKNRKVKDLSQGLEQMDFQRSLHTGGIALDRSECSGGNLVFSFHKSRQTIFPSQLLRNKISKPIYVSLASRLSTLVELSLSNCNISDDIAALDFSKMNHLKLMNLSGNPFRKLPESISSLPILEKFRVNGCRKLQSIPKLPKSLVQLQASGCFSLERNISLQAISTSHHTTVAEILGLGESSKMANNDPEIMNDMEPLELEPLESCLRCVSCTNYVDFDVPKGPLEAFLELGTASFFFRGSSVPPWYGFCSKGSLISFRVPRNRIIRNVSALNVCLLIRGKPAKCLLIRGKPANSSLPSDVPFQCRFRNVTKGNEWLYAPHFSLPPDGQIALLLSHWKLSNRNLEAGDRFIVGPVEWTCTKNGIRYSVEESGVGIVHTDGDNVNKLEGRVQLFPPGRPSGRGEGIRTPNYGFQFYIRE